MTFHLAGDGPCDGNVTRSQVSLSSLLAEAEQCGDMDSEWQGPLALALHQPMMALDRGTGSPFLWWGGGGAALLAASHTPETSSRHPQVGGGLASLSPSPHL